MNRSNPRPRTLSADQLSTALHEVGGTARPGYLEDIVAQAARTRQRPAWTFTERWLPMSIAVRREAYSRAAILFALFLLLLGVVALGISFAGAPKAPAPLVVTNGEIAFARGNDIVALQPDGTGLHALVGAAGAVDSMAYSPDGGRLAYWTVRGSAYDLVVVDADGSHPRTITSGAVHPAEPHWSPDGARLAYADDTTAGQDPGTYRIFVANADGSSARQVANPNGEQRSPDWSPDGATIAFGATVAGSPGVYRLHLMNPDGSNVRQVSDVRGDAFAFVRVDWSRDGSRIAAQAGATDNIQEWDIWVIRVADGSATNVGAHLGGDELIPSWAPDRDALAWAWNSGSTVLLEPGAQPVDLPIGGVSSWSPDGRLLIGEKDGESVVADLKGNVLSTIDGTGPMSWRPVRTGG